MSLVRFQSDAPNIEIDMTKSCAMCEWIKTANLHPVDAADRMSSHKCTAVEVAESQPHTCVMILQMILDDRFGKACLGKPLSAIVLQGKFITHYDVRPALESYFKKNFDPQAIVSWDGSTQECEVQFGRSAHYKYYVTLIANDAAHVYSTDIFNK